MLGCKECGFCTKRSALWIVIADWDSFSLYLINTVFETIDIEVESEAEQMLMDRRGHVGRHQRRNVGSFAAIFDRTHPNDASEFHLHLNGAIEIEVPKKAVFIIPHCVNRTDYKSARSPHFSGLGERISVFPQNAIVFLVHADGIFNPAGGAVPVYDVMIEVIDFAQTVATQS